MEISLESRIVEAVDRDSFWYPHLQTQIREGWRTTSLHLAVFVEPFLSDILAGRKTVESRFSTRRTAPFGVVSKGDTVLIKSSGGPIIGICRVGTVWSYRLSAKSWVEIQERFARAMCAEDPTFWETRQNRSFATLILVESVLPIRPVTYAKQDRRGWVVAKSPSLQLEL